MCFQPWQHIGVFARPCPSGIGHSTLMVTVDDLLQISSKSLKKNALIPSIFLVEDQ